MIHVAGLRWKFVPLVILLVFSAMVDFTTAQQSIPAQSDATWTVALDQAYAPHEYWENNTAKGFNTDIIRSIAEINHWQIIWVPLPWTEAYNALLNGTVESLCMARTPERETLFDFSEPLLNLTLRVFVRRDVSDIQTIGDLAGHTVAVEESDVGHIKIIELCPDAIVVPVASQEEAIRLVARGDVTAAFCNLYAGAYAIIKNAYEGIKIVAEPIPVGVRCIAVGKGNTALLEQINTALETIKATGEYETILKRWFGIYPFPDNSGLLQALELMTTLLLLSLAGVTVVLTWNWSLRQRVKSTTRKLALLGDLFRHDLRNIEQCIYTSLELIKDQQDPTQSTKFLDIAISSLERAEQLTSDVSMIEALTSGEMRPTTTELSSILALATKRFSESHPMVRLSTQYAHPRDLRVLAVQCLDEALVRVLSLLTESTLDDRPKNINIETSVAGKWVTILISSPDVGIPDEQKEGLIRKYQGVAAPVVGLGLSILHASIHASGGDVRIEDRVAGDWRSGIVFRIRLPFQLTF